MWCKRKQVNRRSMDCCGSRRRDVAVQTPLLSRNKALEGSPTESPQSPQRVRLEGAEGPLHRTLIDAPEPPFPRLGLPCA